MRFLIAAGKTVALASLIIVAWYSANELNAMVFPPDPVFLDYVWNGFRWLGVVSAFCGMIAFAFMILLVWFNYFIWLMQADLAKTIEQNKQVFESN